MTQSFSRSMMIGLTLALPGCAGNRPPPSSVRPAPDPLAFFIGHTHGDAELRKLFGSSVRVEVNGVGRKQNGELVLDQTTQEGEQAPKARRWVMRKVGPKQFSGTLSDATGPVQITVEGSHASIGYRAREGFAVHQELAVQPDGRTMLNNLSVKKFGIRVATLHEVIHKLD